MTVELPKRKPNRLTEYDYGTPNAYFITICTDKRKNLFWENMGLPIAAPKEVRLSAYGSIVDRAITNISTYYPAISVDNYVIMPNHIHLLLQISSTGSGRPMVAPTVSTAIQQMKGIVSKQAAFSVWQKSFYDHVIRGEQDYREIWEYIEGNPIRWEQDRLCKGAME